ncbi:unnamed protein product [Effrenium voratum]|nr:unnamed protein product [Effrenium voratum]
MGAPLSRNMCCSIREKDGKGKPLGMEAPQFNCSEVELPLAEPRFVAFSPLWAGNSGITKRMAVASSTTVHVYRVLPESSKPDVPVSLESTLELEDKHRATALIFRDEDLARAPFARVT